MLHPANTCAGLTWCLSTQGMRRGSASWELTQNADNTQTRWGQAVSLWQYQGHMGLEETTRVASIPLEHSRGNKADKELHLDLICVWSEG